MSMFNNSTDHLRSLYISKFRYTRFSQIMKITKMSIFFIGSTSGLNVLCLLFVLVFGRVPAMQNMTLKSRHTGGRALVKIGYTFYNRGEISSIFHKLPLVYFVFLDTEGSFLNMYSKQLSVFKTFLKFNHIFYMFFELDFIFNFAYNTMKFITSQWYFELNIRGYFLENKAVDTFLRSMN